MSFQTWIGYGLKQLSEFEIFRWKFIWTLYSTDAVTYITANFSCSKPAVAEKIRVLNLKTVLRSQRVLSYFSKNCISLPEMIFGGKCWCPHTSWLSTEREVTRAITDVLKEQHSWSDVPWFLNLYTLTMWLSVKTPLPIVSPFIFSHVYIKV